jgi:hypothetical protein
MRATPHRDHAYCRYQVGCLHTAQQIDEGDGMANLNELQSHRAVNQQRGSFRPLWNAVRPVTASGPPYSRSGGSTDSRLCFATIRHLQTV